MVCNIVYAEDLLQWQSVESQRLLEGIKHKNVQQGQLLQGPMHKNLATDSGPEFFSTRPDM